MELNRREFFGTVPAALSLAVSASASDDWDPLRVRADFPVTREGAYLNSAYIAPSPVPVVEAACEFVRSKSARPISLDRMLAKTDDVRRQIARLFGAEPEEIGFLSSTSEGENLVSGALDLKPGENVVLDDLHYNTSYALYKHLEATRGVALRIAKHREGAAPRDVFEPLVDRKTRLLSVAWVSHQNGYRHDLKPLADLAHAFGAYLYTDGVQALGMFPADLHALGVDFVTSGTYKWLLAGYGVAPFYIRRELLDRVPPDRQGALNVEKDLGNYRFEIYKTAKKYEYATLAFGPLYQLGAAVAYLERVGLDRIEAQAVGLAQELHRGLAERGAKLLTPEGNRSSIVAFVNPRPQAEAARVLDDAKVQVSFREKGTQIRVATALFNNRNDVSRFLETMSTLLTVQGRGRWG